jgi:glycosyltransferase involved in cell wall biosynthesis
MNIVLVASRYLPNRGGLESVVHELAGNLRLKGHSVSVVTNRYPHKLAVREIIDGVSVARLHFLFPRSSYVKTRNWRLLLASIAYFPISLIRLWWLLVDQEPDVVNLHYVGSPALFLWLLHRVRRFCFVVSLHGGDVDAEPFQNRLNRWLFGAVLERASRVTVCSQFLLDKAVALAPHVKAKSTVIHNGVDVKLFSSAPPFAHTAPYIFFVGQLEVHKGVDVLLAAFAGISLNHPDVDLIVAGNGSKKASLQEQALRLRIGTRVHFKGACTRETIASLMRGSLGVVIPSRREPFGIVALEALAARAPIIASKVGGLPEALDGFNPVWVTPGDERDLERALEDLIDCGGELRKTQDQGCGFGVQGLDWKVSSERFLDVYRLAT